MGRTLRVLGRIVIGLIAAATVLVGGYAYWMFYDNRMPSEGEFVLDISAIRTEAKTIAGELPERIEVENLSYTPAPKIAMAAGTTWSQVDLVRSSFRVVYPDASVIVETGQSREDAMRFGASSYDDEAWTRMMSALEAANLIVLTHGHSDHAGGLLAVSENDKVRDAAFLNAEQVATMKTSSLTAQPYSASFDADRLLAIAPGIVLIPAPGHTPGSQMIYVRLENGQEVLFMGDTASLADNVARLRPRSRYVMTQIGSDDRRAVFLQTAALQRLSEAEPSLALVPGHDGSEIEKLIKNEVLIHGFGNN